MAEADHQCVFISYARRDGMELALRLRQDLTAAGFDTWLDSERIAGGASWTGEIEAAIDRSRVVLALLTPGSYVSEICRAEQLRSLRKGKCVIPLLAAGETDTPLHLEARQYRDFSDTTAYFTSLAALLNDIRSGNGVALSPAYRTTQVAYVTAPPTVPNYIHLPEAVRAIRDALFGGEAHRAVALTALEGMGGIGKTVLAQALFQDDVIQQAFPDGLVWITAGREPAYEVAAKQREIAGLLGAASDAQMSPEILYRTTVRDKAALVVIDDVWNKAHLEPFLAESPRSRFLFTTRDSSIARFCGSREYRVDLLEEGHARELLALWAGLDAGRLPPAAADVLAECGGLPLALSTVGALLRGAGAADWADTVRLLRRADLSAIERLLPPGQESFFRAIDVSVKALEPQMQHRYQRLAALLDDMSAPVDVLRTLWNVDEAEARRVARRLADKSLAQQDEKGALRLHDLQLDYARTQFADAVSLELIRGAVRLSAHVIEKDAGQFASQVLGRLLPYRGQPAIKSFLDDVSSGAPLPWLRPLHPALHPPGTPLLRTLLGHMNHVHAVAMTSDGQRAVSASWDRTLKVWDLDSGRELRTLSGHTDQVEAVAVAADGQRAVSASHDGTLKVWDLNSGHELLTLPCHKGGVAAVVALTGDGKRAVSALDGTLRVWDLDSGHELLSLQGRLNSIKAVAMTPDGSRVVAASLDLTSYTHKLTVWDLDGGREPLALPGNGETVWAVAVTPDGHRAVSASHDHTLTVWDLDSGRELRTLSGHSNIVSAVAVTADGHRAVSGSHDQTLKVWDLDSGRALRTLSGHASPAIAVSLTADGRRAVSGDLGGSLKVWDLTNGRDPGAPSGHTDSVKAIAVTADGRRVVSASSDGSLKVWDLDSGRELHNLSGHTAAVNAVAVDGRRAVSASTDRTLKVWDLDGGRELRTLAGTETGISSVALIPGGRRVVSASADSLKVWDLDSGRELRTLAAGNFTTVVVTADGQCAICGYYYGMDLTVFDLNTGRKLRNLGHKNSGKAVGVAADGNRVVSACLDYTLKVWDLDSGREMCTLSGHTSAVNAVAVTADGQRAVSASSDHTLKVWDLSNNHLVATFHCDGEPDCCVFVDDHRIVAGDAGGRIYVLSLMESPGSLTVPDPQPDEAVPRAAGIARVQAWFRRLRV